jgi:hypothetical protein
VIVSVKDTHRAKSRVRLTAASTAAYEITIADAAGHRVCSALLTCTLRPAQAAESGTGNFPETQSATATCGLLSHA